MQRQDEDNARSPLLKLLIIVTLMTIVVAIGYLLHYYFRDSDGDIIWYPPDALCDLRQGTCHADLGSGKEVSLALGNDLAPRAPLAIDVTMRGLEPCQVVVEFIGLNMHMGSQRFILDARGDGHFHAVGRLSASAEPVTRWRAQVVITTGAGRRGSWFDFDVHR